MAKKKPEAPVKPAYGTRPTQVRFTDEYKDRIEAIRARYKLPSASDAIRWAIDTEYFHPRPGEKKPRKKKPGTPLDL